MKRKILKLVADGFHQEALTLYTRHHSSSLRAHKFTFPPLFKACAKLKSPPQGRMAHTQLIKMGFQADIYAATALTDMYMKLGFLRDAVKVFDEMPERNVASLNAMISGFSQNGFSKEAWVVKNKVFGTWKANSVTISCLLSACDDVYNGKGIHCWAVKLGVEKDVYVATSLVSLYFNCEEIVFAFKLFDEMPEKNVVSYNACMSGLIQNGMPSVVFDVFKQMKERVYWELNEVTFASVLCACSSLLYLPFGRQIHGLILKVKLREESDPVVGTALVDMYLKCGDWKCAYQVFEEIKDIRNLITWNSMISGMMLNEQSEIAVQLFELLKTDSGFKPDSVTWNSMISGFSQRGKSAEAFSYFRKMQSGGISPCLKSTTSILSACSDLSDFQCGREIHGYAIKSLENTEVFIVTAIIDMYMKCGYSSWARRVFNQFDRKPKDHAFWNAMISGYGRNGESRTAFEIFYQMLEERVHPSAATFSCVLSLCSHTGQVKKGWEIFNMMNREYGVEPDSDHYGCMVDLLGRSGQLDKARELILKIRKPSSSVFSSLLGSCKSHLDPKLGEEMVLKILELEPENPTPIVILSNIYADLGRWSDVERVREMMNHKGLRKLPGFSSIVVT